MPAIDAFTAVDLSSEKTKGTGQMVCLGDKTGPEQLREITTKWMTVVERI